MRLDLDIVQLSLLLLCLLGEGRRCREIDGAVLLLGQLVVETLCHLDTLLALVGDLLVPLVHEERRAQEVAINALIELDLLPFNFLEMGL